MTEVYSKVIVAGLQNYLGTRLQLPSNVHCIEWEGLAHTEEDTTLINFLKFSFPVRYEGPVMIPADHNHAPAMHHPRDLAAYVLCQN